MAELTPEQAVEQARAAAQVARDAANQAQGIVDQLAATAGGAAHAVSGAIDPFVFQLSIFVIAIFVGYYVVWRVTPALHSPLMSVTNAVSSVVIIGALIAAGPVLFSFSKLMGFMAVALASVNIFGGFIVTQRMLQMFKKKQG